MIIFCVCVCDSPTSGSTMYPNFYYSTSNRVVLVFTADGSSTAGHGGVCGQHCGLPRHAHVLWLHLVLAVPVRHSTRLRVVCSSTAYGSTDGSCVLTGSGSSFLTGPSSSIYPGYLFTLSGPALQVRCWWWR